jgi:hypothetical protein
MRERGWRRRETLKARKERGEKAEERREGREGEGEGGNETSDAPR